MSPTDIRHPLARAVLRKTPPQGLRLRRFKRQVMPGLVAGTAGVTARSGGLRKPSLPLSRV